MCWSCSLQEGWLICRSRFKPKPAGIFFRQSNVFLYVNPCSSSPKWKGYWLILWGLTSASLSGGDWVPVGSPRASTYYRLSSASMSSNVSPATQPWAPTQGSQAPLHTDKQWKKGGGTGLTATHPLFIEFNNGIQLCSGLTSCPWGISKTSIYFSYLFSFISFAYYWTMNNKCLMGRGATIAVSQLQWSQYLIKLKPG